MEKARVVVHDGPERTFHVLYSLALGAGGDAGDAGGDDGASARRSPCLCLGERDAADTLARSVS